jgi:peptidoglycan/LPS O-acetylase OafA/YrhL
MTYTVRGGGMVRLRLECVSASSENNLNLLRLCFAIFVLISHAFPIARGSDASDGVLDFLHFSLGTLGVYGFFFISGFLIYRSLLQRADLAFT